MMIMPSIPIPPPAAVSAAVPHDHVTGLLSAYGDGWLTSATGSLGFDALLMAVAALAVLAIARMRITPSWSVSPMAGRRITPRVAQGPQARRSPWLRTRS
jgi:hypothetical protein